MTNQSRQDQPAASTSTVSCDEPAAGRRRTPVTIALVAIPLAVLLAVWTQGVSPFELRLGVNHERLKPWGANYGPSTANGEGWRLLSAVFIPANVAQFLVNAWALWGLGRFLERLVGGFAFGVLFVLCGFAGNLSALIWNPAAVIAGAAPAILGLVAAGAAIFLCSRGAVSQGAMSQGAVSQIAVSQGAAPREVVKRFRLSLFTFLAFNAGGELMQDCLVFAAYLGAAATGFVSGLVLGWPLSGVEGQSRAVRGGFLAFTAVVSALLAPTLTPRVDNVDALYFELVDVEHKAVEIYEMAKAGREQGRLNDVELANIIEDEVLPYWREMSERFAALHHVLPHDVKRLAAIKEYLKRRDDAWQTLADGLRRGDHELIDSAIQKAAEADEAAAAIGTAARPGNE